MHDDDGRDATEFKHVGAAAPQQDCAAGTCLMLDGTPTPTRSAAYSVRALHHTITPGRLTSAPTVRRRCSTQPRIWLAARRGTHINSSYHNSEQYLLTYDTNIIYVVAGRIARTRTADDRPQYISQQGPRTADIGIHVNGFPIGCTMPDDTYPVRKHGTEHMHFLSKCKFPEWPILPKREEHSKLGAVPELPTLHRAVKYYKLP